jgi:hypothetical protein
VQLGRAAVVDDRRARGLERLEQAAAVAVVHRPPVVGVDERQVEQLGALIGVGDARHRQLHQLLRERGRPPRRRQLLDQRRDVRADRLVGQHRPRERLDRRFEVGIRVEPRRARLRLAGRLLQVRDQPVGVDRPGAEEGLPDQLLGDVVRACGGPVVRGHR